jgi:protein involved in polysaccharide export with SLBB domain
VEVTGAVRRPGHYELTDQKDVAELLALAGGTSTELASGLPFRISSRAEDDRRHARSVSSSEAPSVPLHDGDAVHVPMLSDLRRLIVVEGAIAGVPGALTERQRAPVLVDRHADTTSSAPREISVSLPFVEGEGVRDLLRKAGGLEPWADGARAYLLREEKRIPIDVVAISSGAAADVPAAAGDTLVVPSRRVAVLVGGAVQHPGLYQFSRDLQPGDYIQMAGGPTRTGNAGAARVLAANGQSRKASGVSAVGPGDTITVPEHRVSTAEWITIALVVTNVAVAAAALGITLSR